MGRPNNLASQRFGRMLVVATAYPPNRHLSQGYLAQAWWLCKCDCGKEATVVAFNLKNGRARSCGCLRAEEASKRLSQRQSESKRHTGTPAELVRKESEK